MSEYSMELNSGWKAEHFFPFRELVIKTADQKRVEFRKVVKGEWINCSGSEEMVKCSNCDIIFTEDFIEGMPPYGSKSKRPNYCPNCGADMRGEV